LIRTKTRTCGQRHGVFILASTSRM
jgi:hypothetical protein